ncbi:MAG TPA: DUF885 domain-containing protein [Thermoanaerobaculia bacterium]|nr:DUF885 domain-containing protein [Thermoanaerobaculia bacterium]
MLKKLTLLVASLLLFSSVLSAAELSAADLDRRRKALADLIDAQWQWTMRRAPEYASILGDKRYNDRVSDFSEKSVQESLAGTRDFLRRFEAIDPLAFSEQERLNRELMIRDLRETLEGAKLNDWQMPVTQQSGFHLSAAQLPSMLTFTAAKDYDDYIARMHQFPKQMRDLTANMRKGMAAKRMPPRFLLEKVAEQAAGLAAMEPEKSPFAASLESFPASVSEADRTRIRTAMLDAIRTEVLPAYAEFAKFVRDEYAPHGRTEPGIWALPDGAARYAFLAKQSTTTDLTPAQIHEIGLREVARIEGEMRAIAKAQGYDDLKKFNAFIDANPELKAKTPENLLNLYRGFIDQMYAKLPQLFGRLPKAKLEVVPTEPFREQTAASAEYNAGAPDGSRPGRVMVNTYDSANRKIIFTESTAYHEGVPGHHMQVSIAQELTDLPTFRQQGGYTAFVEGWALYSERLGKEVGFYQNAFIDYGRLNDEMLRAIRLVVDTGLHSKKWTREQVVQFFRDHSATDEVEIQSETDRYIAWPGQALAYKIGQLKILELREKAQRELGAKFDIRAFHDEVLGAGALPLGVLEQRIDRWIDAEAHRLTGS